MLTSLEDYLCRKKGEKKKKKKKKAPVTCAANSQYGMTLGLKSAMLIIVVNYSSEFLAWGLEKV